MKRALVVLGLVGCGRKHAPPAAGEARPVTLIGCELAWRPTADATEVVPVSPTLPAPRPPPGPPAPDGGGDALVIDVQPPDVVGGLSANVVRKALRGAHDAMEHCYAGRLATRPGLAGNVDLDFTIGPDGKAVSPSSAGLDRALGQCLVRVVNTLELPKPRGGGAKVRVTVVLHPAVDDTPVTDDEPVDVIDVPPPPESVLASLAWADDGADAGLAAWASERAAPSIAAIDLSGCALGATGTVSALLGVDRDGKVVAAEVGGVGSAAVEDCVHTALAAATVAPPPTAAALRCDLAVGAPGPARITLRPGEPVIEVGADIRIAGAPVAILELPAAIAALRAGGTATVLVRSTGHADAALVTAVTAALASAPYLVGVEDATGGLALVADAVVRGAGRPRATVGTRPRLDLGGGQVVATVPGRGVIATGALADPASVRAVLAEVAACGECERVIEVAAHPGVEARALGEIAASSAAAGVPRLVLVTL